jgi:hypothetical protein
MQIYYIDLLKSNEPFCVNFIDYNLRRPSYPIAYTGDGEIIVHCVSCNTESTIGENLIHGKPFYHETPFKCPQCDFQMKIGILEDKAHKIVAQEIIA